MKAKEKAIKIIASYVFFGKLVLLNQIENDKNRIKYY